MVPRYLSARLAQAASSFPLGELPKLLSHKERASPTRNLGPQSLVQTHLEEVPG